MISVKSVVSVMLFVVVSFINTGLAAAANSLGWYGDVKATIFRSKLCAGGESIAFSQSGRFVASGFYCGKIEVWDIVTRQSRIIKGPRNYPVDSIAFSADDNFIVAAYATAIKVWDLRTPLNAPCVDEIVSKKAFGYSNVGISPNGEFFAFASEGKINMRGIRSREYEYSQALVSNKNSYAYIAFSFNGLFLVALNVKGEACVCDMCSKKVETYGCSNQGYHSSVAISSDGNFLATGSDFGMFRVWDLPARKCLYWFQRPKDSKITAVTFSPDDKLVAAASLDGFIHLVDLKTGKFVKQLDVNAEMRHFNIPIIHSKIVIGETWANSVNFNKTGTMLAAGLNDGKVVLYDANDYLKEEIKALACAQIQRLGADSFARHLVQADLHLIYELSIADR